MSILSFDKPEKVNSTDEHNKKFSSDSGVAGTYVPNMSTDDQLKYKAKLVNKGKTNARIEIRKTFTNPGYSQVLIIVALDGWDYKETQKETKGMNVRISMNGPAIMTFDDFQELNQAITEAREFLK